MTDRQVDMGDEKVSGNVVRVMTEWVNLQQEQEVGADEGRKDRQREQMVVVKEERVDRQVGCVGSQEVSKDWDSVSCSIKCFESLGL